MDVTKRKGTKPEEGTDQETPHGLILLENEEQQTRHGAREKEAVNRVTVRKRGAGTSHFNREPPEPQPNSNRTSHRDKLRAMKTCPDCFGELRPEAVLDFEVDVCTHCAGVWFDEGELAKLRSAGSVELAILEDKFVPRIEPAVTERARACPVCGNGLRGFHYMYSTPVQLDQCDECGGIWVQDGELRQMAKVLEGALPETVNPAILARIRLVADEADHNAQLHRHRGFVSAMRVINVQKGARK